MKHAAHAKGQTIVEAIVVISVVVLLVTGLIAGTTTSLKSAQSGRTRGQATKFAEEGLEYARSLRDQGWSAFQAYSGVYCYGSDRVLSPSAGGGCTTNITTLDSTYIRSLTFTWDGTKMTVISKVAFPVSGVNTDVSLTTYLTNWK